MVFAYHYYDRPAVQYQAANSSIVTEVEARVWFPSVSLVQLDSSSGVILASVNSSDHSDLDPDLSRLLDRSQATYYELERRWYGSPSYRTA